jgi:hypothetical protein
MLIADANYYVRRDIGDPAETFMTNSLTDGLTVVFDLPQQNINSVGLNVQYLPQGSGIFDVIQPTSAYPAWNESSSYNVGALVSYSGYYYHCTEFSPPGTVPLANGQNSTYWVTDIVYSLDAVAGKISTNTPIPNNSTLLVSGQAWGMFTDTELNDIIYTAVRKHCQGQTITERYKVQQGGAITYRDTPKDLLHLPKEEESLLVTLADIECFYILATDSATDVNLQTAEGTVIDRSARYNQIMSHIDALWSWYNLQCAQWNVGMNRMESLVQRRVSRTTGRLVPIFRDREYDDHRYPERQLPQIDRRDTDTSGVPSPIWNGSPL